MNPTKDPVYDKDDQRPVMRPGLRQLEEGARSGGTGSSASTNFNFNPNGDKKKASSTGSADPGDGDDSGFRFSPKGDEASGHTGTAGLLAKEVAAGGGIGGAAATFAGGAKNFFWGSKNRKRSTVIGGGFTAAIIGGTVAFTFISGPFEFIHIAQLMEQMHFATLQDDSDDRLFKEMRYVHYQRSGEAYKTNLGYIGNKLANKFEADLNKAGLESAYTPVFGMKDGYIIDTESEQLKGMNDNEIKAYYNDKFNADGKLEFSTITDTDGNTRLLMKQPSGYFLSKRITKVTLQDADLKGITSSIGARIMGTRDGISWHPLKKLDNKTFKTLEEKYAEWNKERAANESEGIGDVNGVSANPEDKEGTAADGEAATDSEQTAQEGNDASQKAQSGSSDSESSLSSFTDHVGVKITAGGAAAAGVLCMARSLAEQAGDVKQAQVALPLIRIGMRTLTEGNQLMAGQDVPVDQISLDSKQLYDAASKTDWSAAQSIQAETGHPNKGVPPDDTLKTIGSGTPLDFLLSGAANTVLGPVCSTGGQIIQGVIGFLGGPFSFAGSTLASMVAGPTIMSTISHWLAGQAVDYMGAKGATFGSYSDYGLRLAANDQGISAGGRALSSQEEGQLATLNNTEIKNEFGQHNLVYRVFDPNDRLSLVSSLMDNQSNDVSANLSNMAFATLGATHSIASTFSSLFSSFAFADTQQGTYDYGFPEVGFSESEMENPDVANPYANADAVATILDKNGQNGEPDYISRANDCFGDTLDQVSVPDSGNGGNDQVWDVSFGTNPVNIYSAQYKSIESSCNDTSDPNWVRIRFFIFDMQTVKAADCYQGDDQMCSEMGFGGSSGNSDTSTTTTTGSLPSGTAQQLAQQILNNPRVGYEFSAKTDMQDAAQGKPGTCNAPLSPVLLGLLAELAQNHTFNISALESECQGHSGPGDPHYEGRAADIVNVDGDPTAESGIGRTANDKAVISELAPLMTATPSSDNGDWMKWSGFGQVQCGATPPLPNGIKTFTDRCSHLHIQVTPGSGSADTGGT